MSWRSSGYGDNVRHFKVKQKYQKLNIPKYGIRVKLSLDNMLQARESSRAMYSLFQNAQDREVKKKIKKAMVSAANRAKATNMDISNHYREIYLKMNLPKK